MLTSRRHLSAAVLIASLLVGACGVQSEVSDVDARLTALEEENARLQAELAEAAAAATSTTTSTTRPPAFDTEGLLVLDVPPSLNQTPPGNGAGYDASGSGCVPPQDALTDGVWFGYVLDIPSVGSGDAISFDMACLYDDEAAVWEAAYDNRAPTDNGLYVRNRNPKTYVGVVATDATVLWIDRSIQHQETAFADWPGPAADRHLACPSQECGVWVYVNSGKITEIVEQYFG